MHRRRKDPGTEWTPYGHEKARRQLLMQRHAWLAVGALALAMFYGVFLSLTVSVETEVDSGGQIEIRREEQRPMTVTVSPGRAPGFVDGQAQDPQGIEAPEVEREDEGLIMSTLRPIFPVIAPLVGALWLLSRVGASARGRLAELNFGVYKGAMPYEMHTAKRMKLVFTHRQVETHLFGKSREDFLAGTYLDRPPLSVRRILGDTDIEEAEIARLRRAGMAKAKVSPSSSSPSTRLRPSGPDLQDSLQARLRDAWDEEGFGGVWNAARREHLRRRELKRRIQRAHRLRVARQKQAALQAQETGSG